MDYTNKNERTVPREIDRGLSLEDRAKNQRSKKGLTLSNVCTLALFLCCALVGVLPQPIIAMAVIALSAVLLIAGNGYLAFPIMIFYYNMFGMFIGLSVFRYFTLMFFTVAVFSHYKKIRLKFPYFLVLLVYLTYSIYFAFFHGMKMGVFAFFDIVCIFLLVIIFLSDTEKLKKFFSVYVITCLLSFLTGFINHTTMVIGQGKGENYVEIFRNIATFEDPNYMGFFFSVGIFAMIALRLFGKRTRVIFTVALYAMMLSSLSITAIIGNLLFWLIYLVITKQINGKVFAVVVAILTFLTLLYLYGLTSADSSVLSMLAKRINDKAGGFLGGDMNMVTTGRTGLAAQHFEAFLDQSVLKQLFGFNAVNTLMLDFGNFETAAHNEYVDMLLNVGFVGALVLLGFAVQRLIFSARRYIKVKDRAALCNFMVKFIWFYYAMTLTLFYDNRFLLAFLL